MAAHQSCSRAVTLFVLVMLALTGAAHAGNGDGQENDLLIISGEPQNQQNVEDGSLSVVYNPRSLDSEIGIPAPPIPESGIVIPEGPANDEEADLLQTLSESDQHRFLVNKKKFLSKLSNTLSFFRLKATLINKALKGLNKQFYGSPKVVSSANTDGGFLLFSASVGLGLPQKITEFIRSRPLGKLLPKSGGFYFLLGLGIAVVRRVDPLIKKASWFLESYVDTESLDRVHTFLAKLAVNISPGILYENRPDSFWSQKFKRLYAGAAGNFEKGDHVFAWNTTVGVSLPPGTGVFYVFEADGTRRYFVRLNLSKYLIDPFAKLLNLFSADRAAAGGMRCEAAYTL